MKIVDQPWYLACRILSKSWMMACLFLPWATGAALHAQMFYPQRYSCLTRELDTEKWLREGFRNFDQYGVLVQAGAYHPVGIASYGIMRYEDYQATGQADYRKAVIEQYRYFCDTTLVMLVDSGQGMMLPYRIVWKDNIPPWQSGMAQGLALSYLLRYYTLTRDQTALQKMKQVAHVLLKPAHVGGTIGRTPEGYPWIEEYPQSKIYRNVLNGSINGLIGLHEYCMLFPTDDFAGRMRDSCLQSLRLTLSQYDTPDWTLYRRAENAMLQPHYLRYQLAELDHLSELFPEAIWERQMMLWAVKGYQKSDSTVKSYRVPNYEYAWEALDDSLHEAKVDLRAFLKAMAPIQIFGSVEEQAPPLQLPLTIKAHAKRIVFFKSFDELVTLTFKEAKAQQIMSVVAQGYNGKPLPLQQFWEGPRLTLLAEDAISGLTLDAFTAAPCTLTQIETPDPALRQVPRFGFLLWGERIALQKWQACKINCVLEQVKHAHLFYRHAPSEAQWSTATWRQEQFQTWPLYAFTAPETGLYEFLLVFYIDRPNPRVLQLDIHALGD